MSKLTEILNHCADQSQNFTLKILVIYGNRTQRLQWYHIPGQPWVIFDHADMIEFTEAQMTQAMRAAGVDMTTRPIKQGMAYHWLIDVVPGRQNVRMMHAASADSIERKRINQLYQEQQDARDLRTGAIENDVFSSLPQELQAAIVGD